MSPPRLTINALAVTLRNRVVLRDISLVPQQGAVTAIIGPNASGKTTLLRACLGSVPPSAGNVLLDDKPVHQLPARLIAQHLAYVAQRASTTVGLSALEVIELGRYARPFHTDRIDQAVATMQIEPLLHRPLAELSVGQQQRIMMARALAQVEPSSYLLLDEPTAAMDLAWAQHTLAVVRNLANDGVTVLMVLHDVNDALAIADNALLLKEGHLIASGHTKDVITPGTLEQVFDVSFTAITHDNRNIILPARHHSSSQRTTAI
ncbi:MAG: ABC transporter ATP-binding protein [Phycisphaerales bacterium]